MALPLGKLTIIFGAGILGSVLAKEGRIPNVSDLVSGAFKIVLKPIRQEDSTNSTSKQPHNDSLLQQVNSLRQELQHLASNRSVTIVTSSGSGSSRYSIIIVVVVMGYGYIWWKGWKLPDFMFSTRRGLADACAGVSKQLESVYSSVAATKRHLSSRIDRVDSKIDECVDDTAATGEEVSEVRGKVRKIGDDVQLVHCDVKELKTKIIRIEGRQNDTNSGVGKLVAFVRSMENSRATEQIEASPSTLSRPALEFPQEATSTRARSLPPDSSVEPPSPSASIVSERRPLQSAVSPAGLKELTGMSGVFEVSTESSPQVLDAALTSEENESSSSSSGAFGHKLFSWFSYKKKS